MILLRMLAFRPAVVDADSVPQAQTQPETQTHVQETAQPQVLAQRNAQVLKSKVQTEPVVQPVKDAVKDLIREQDAAQYAELPAAAAQTASGNAVSNDWRDIVNALGLGGLVKQLAINCTMQQRDGRNIVLHIASGHSNLINPKAQQRLQQALGEYFNIDAQLEVKVVNKNQIGSKSESPAQAIQRETKQRQQQAVEAINEDSFTRSLKENFNAEIIPGSVKPVT
jgi:DNA polymerase-3 subunit gamma/tau